MITQTLPKMPKLEIEGYMNTVSKTKAHVTSADRRNALNLMSSIQHTIADGFFPMIASICFVIYKYETSKNITAWVEIDTTKKAYLLTSRVETQGWKLRNTSGFVNYKLTLEFHFDY